LFDRGSSSLSRLTEEQRWSIIALHRDGQQRRVIANKIPCSLNTVNHWIHHYEHNNTVADQPRSGCKRQTDEKTDINIVVSAAVEKFIVPKKIKRELDLTVSPRTVRRRLNEAGLFGRISRKEYPLTEEHVRKRLSFANGYSSWTIAQWGSVLFSDETLVELGVNGPVWVQRPAGMAFDPQYLSHKEPHPERVCVWACFSRAGIGDMHVFDENLDGAGMRLILQSHLIPSAERLFTENTVWWLLQDNDPKHRSRLVQDWLFFKGIQCIDFPPHSPDLNPMENLWNRLKRRVEEHNPRTIEELQQQLHSAWQRISKKFLAKLSDSMPRRCQAVIASKGHITKY
jgi:transposase